MKFVIIALCVIGCVFAVDDKAAQVLKSEYDISPEGNYQYSYETENGISGEARSELKNINKDEIAANIFGRYQYVAPDGQTIEVSYTADENGFQPVGAHLPTPPPTAPLPEYIARAIAYIAAHPPLEEKNQRKP